MPAYKVYGEDRGSRLKEGMLEMKENIIDTKLLPYFGAKCIGNITTKDVMIWQNKMLNYRDQEAEKLYSKSYFKNT